MKSLTPEAEEFLDSMRDLVSYWSEVTDRTPTRLLEGFAHSILALLDGVAEIDAIDLHENGKDITDNMMLHEFWYKK